MGLLYEDLSYKLRGMFFKIYNDVGPGFKEQIYTKSLITLFDEYKIPYEKEKRFDLTFRDTRVGITQIDLVVDNKIIVEIKATEVNNSLFEKQILSYLKGTKLPLGLLVNFGMNKLYIRRFANSMNYTSA